MSTPTATAILRVVLPIRAAILAIAVSGTLGACASAPTMTAIGAPVEGISLRYDLAQGQTYSGQLRRSETVRDALSGSIMSRSIAFNVELVVMGPADSGGKRVVATLTNIDLRWSLPAGSPFSPDEFSRTTVQVLDGLQVDLHVSDHGEVLYRPPLPDSISSELAIVLSGALDLIETAFLKLPSRPQQIGESWSDEKVRGREGKLGVFTTGDVTTKVAGLFRDAAGEELAKLEIQDNERAMTMTEEGSRENRREGTMISLFSTSGSYLVSTRGQITEFGADRSTTVVMIQVDWTKGEKRPSTPQKKRLPLDLPL